MHLLRKQPWHCNMLRTCNYSSAVTAPSTAWVGSGVLGSFLFNSLPLKSTRSKLVYLVIPYWLNYLKQFVAASWHGFKCVSPGRVSRQWYLLFMWVRLVIWHVWRLILGVILVTVAILAEDCIKLGYSAVRSGPCCTVTKQHFQERQ